MQSLGKGEDIHVGTTKEMACRISVFQSKYKISMEKRILGGAMPYV